MFKRIILAITLMFAFSHSASADADFMRSAIQMGTTFCPNVNFDCGNLLSQRQEIVAAANNCIAERMMIPDKIMNDFRSSGEYENCVLPDQPSKNSSGVSVWAVCCVKKDSSSDTCTMSCTRYISQK